MFVATGPRAEEIHLENPIFGGDGSDFLTELLECVLLHFAHDMVVVSALYKSGSDFRFFSLISGSVLSHDPEMIQIQWNFLCSGINHDDECNSEDTRSMSVWRRMSAAAGIRTRAMSLEGSDPNQLDHSCTEISLIHSCI